MGLGGWSSLKTIPSAVPWNTGLLPAAVVLRSEDLAPPEIFLWAAAAVAKRRGEARRNSN